MNNGQSNNKIIPVLIAIIAVLLIGFGIALGVLLGSGRNKDNGSEQSAPAETSPVTEAATTVTETETAENTTVPETTAAEETTAEKTTAEKKTEPATQKQNNTQSVDYHTDHRSGAGSDFVYDTSGEGTAGQVATQSDPLNLRAKPDSNAEIIAKMPRGCDVGIFGSNSDWYYLHYSENGVSYYGYASRQYVRNLRYEDKIDTNQSNNSRSVDYHTDHRSGAYAGFPFYSSPASGVVFTESGSLNLRAIPDTNAEIIAQMPKGTYIDVWGADNNWCYVRYDANGTSYYGYASRQFVNDGGI